MYFKNPNIELIALPKSMAPAHLVLLVVLSLLVASTLGAQQTCIIYDTNAVCLQCTSNYYLNPSSSVCTLCSSLFANCLTCNSTACISCESSYTLLLPNLTCIYCPQGFYYDSAQSMCSPCMANCKYCNDNSTCTRCFSGYFYYSPNNSCVLTSSFNISNSNITLSYPTYEEYLLDLMPDLQSEIQSRYDLGFVCYNNDYSCLCPNYTTDSRCNSFSKSTVKSVLQNLTARLPNVLISDMNPYLRALRLAYQSAGGDVDSTTTFLSNLGTLIPSLTTLSVYNLRLLFEIMASLEYSVSQLQTLTNNLNALSAIVKTLPPQNITPQTFILEGNGYIYRLNLYNNQKSANPTIYANLSTVYNTNVTGTETLLLLFDRLQGIHPYSGYLLTSTSGIAGAALSRNITFPVISSPVPTVGYNVSMLRQTGYPDNYTPSITNRLLTFSYSGSASGVFNVTSNTTWVDYTLSSQSTRIERMFYQPSIFYILFFLVLYLVLFPLCMLVNCCEEKVVHRRRPRETTQEALRVDSEHHVDPPSSSADDAVVPVTFKQFFPPYNVAATPNTNSRLSKLALYLLNMQHSITFLTLLYLAAKSPLVAILLAIPAYIMNLIAGYFCGFLKRTLPQKTKIIVLICIAVGYWILWFFLMRNQAAEYRQYLLVFVIVLWFLDQLFDALQTLIMYFVLKEENAQAYRLFSRVLSLRGYFEYDKYAAN